MIKRKINNESFIISVNSIQVQWDFKIIKTIIAQSNGMGYLAS